MKRQLSPIPKPRSSFLVVRCPDCGADRTIFSHSTITITCRSCNRVLARPRGGEAEILGNIVRRFD